MFTKMKVRVKQNLICRRGDDDQKVNLSNQSLTIRSTPETVNFERTVQSDDLKVSLTWHVARLRRYHPLVEEPISLKG